MGSIVTLDGGVKQNSPLRNKTKKQQHQVYPGQLQGKKGTIPDYALSLRRMEAPKQFHLSQTRTLYFTITTCWKGYQDLR